MTTEPVQRAVSGWLTRYAPTDSVMVAVSGGADSTALALATLRAAGRDRVTAITIDHQLQEFSGEQARRCVDQLRDNGFARVEVLTVDCRNLPGGVEAAARTARYAALRERAMQIGQTQPCPVLLGHTLDDQAETVLLGLARGSGPRSIAGMRTWRNPWGRPLLGVRRADTESFCAASGLTIWQDPHNSNPAFTRVRLRTEVLPLLEDVLCGGVAPALARTAELLTEDNQALDEFADELLAAARRAAAGPSGDALDCAILRAAPVALRRRAVRRWVADAGITSLTAQHLRRLDDLLDARDGAAVRLPGGQDVYQRGGRLERSVS